MKKMKMARGTRDVPSKKLHHIEVEPAEGGGHVVTHHFKSGDGSYHEPEKHAFGDGEGSKAMDHISAAANIVADSGDADPKHSKELEDQGEKENG